MPSAPEPGAARPAADRIPVDSPELAARQAEIVRRLGPYAGPVDDELHAILRLATSTTGAARASINLFDEEEQLMLPGDGRPPFCVPREVSICVRTSQLPGVFVRPDLAADPEWSGHPVVDGRLGRTRFYASAPMRLPSGDVLGTLCVVDEEPRELTGEQVDRLADLATVALGLMERRWHLTRAVQAAALAQEAEERNARAAAFQRELLDALTVGVLAADGTGRPVLVNRVLAGWTGCLREDGSVDPAALDDELYGTDGRTRLAPEDTPLARALRGEQVRDVELVAGPPGGPRRRVVTSASAVHGADGTRLGAVVTATDVTCRRALEERVRAAAPPAG
jgi:PAS domain-containing protein